MDIDNILTLPRWRILEIVSNKPSSPLEISNQLNTSVAYVSQQLKLLEAANIVKKDKTGNVAKGKPRFLFSITKDILHMTVLSNNFSTKKLLNLDEKNKVLLRIWLVEDPKLRYSLERVYWLIEKDFSAISEIYLDQESNKKATLIIIAEPGKLNVKPALLAQHFDNLFQISVLKELGARKNSTSLIPIYKSNLINVEKTLKGGST